MGLGTGGSSIIRKPGITSRKLYLRNTLSNVTICDTVFDYFYDLNLINILWYSLGNFIISFTFKPGLVRLGSRGCYNLSLSVDAIDCSAY